MLLKDEACRAGAGEGGAGSTGPSPLPPATHAVRLPQALLPPPPLVLPDEPGRGALLGGAAQPGVADVGAWGSGGTKVRVQRSGARGGCRGGDAAYKQASHPLHVVEGRGRRWQVRQVVSVRISSWLHTPRSARVTHANPHPRGSLLPGEHGDTGKYQVSLHGLHNGHTQVCTKCTWTHTCVRTCIQHARTLVHTHARPHTPMCAYTHVYNMHTCL